MKTSYDHRIIIPGPPRGQQRHRSVIMGKCKKKIAVLQALRELFRADLSCLHQIGYETKQYYLVEIIKALAEPLPIVRMYDPSAPDKKFIKAEVRPLTPKKLPECLIQVDLFLYFKRPKSHYRTGKFAGQLRPDAPLRCGYGYDRDNADKIILDALEGIFWRNDKRVCDGRIVKLYATKPKKPRTEVYIKILEPGRVGEPIEPQTLFTKGTEDDQK